MRHKNTYLQKREEEQAARTAAGLISERYAGISCVELHMVYYHRATNPVLMERTRRFSPENHARFFLPCEQDGCAGGGYDLTKVIDGLARSRKTSAKGKLFCHGSEGAIGHGSIAYDITIQYCQRGARMRPGAAQRKRLHK